MKEWIKKHKVLSSFIFLIVIAFVFISFFPENSEQTGLTGNVVEGDIQKGTPEKIETNEQQINYEEQIPEQETEEIVIKVTKIVDGDTLDINTGERVRLICIDTPERGEYYYSEASDYLEELVLNKEVELTKDKSETDRYGRLLRYIYVDGLFVNEEMVKKGYAKAYPYNPDTTLCPQIEEAETQAKSRDLGIWEKQETNEVTPTESSGCGGNVYNCGDFSSCSEVMEVFNSCSYDVNYLDGDEDGIPCESIC